MPSRHKLSRSACTISHSSALARWWFRRTGLEERLSDDDVGSAVDAIGPVVSVDAEGRAGEEHVGLEVVEGRVDRLRAVEDGREVGQAVPGVVCSKQQVKTRLFAF